MDALCYPDRTPHTGLLEYKKVIQPMKVEAVDLTKGVFDVTNLYAFRTFDGMEANWMVEVDGHAVQQGDLKLDIAPYATQRVTIDYKLPACGNAFLTITLREKYDTNWCAAGHEVAVAQFELPDGSFAKKLYSLYLTYLPTDKFKYAFFLKRATPTSFC